MLPWLAGASAAGSLLSGFGSLLGGKKHEDAAQNLIDYNKNVESWHNEMAKTIRDRSIRNAKRAKGGVDRDIAGIRKDRLATAKDLRGKLKGTAQRERKQNREILSGAESAGLNALIQDRNLGIEDVNRTRRQNMGDVRGDLRSGLSDVADTRHQNLRTARGARDASLGYFEPAISAGNNALSAYAGMLGIGKMPKRYDMALTPATQFELEQGRNTVEGGAAGGGGLYSGETLSDLEKLRTGLVSQDYNNQMAQLFGLIGTGQSAAGSSAGIQSDFRNSANGIRDNATSANLGLRDNATQTGIGIRDDATKANVIFFDNRAAAKEPQTREVWYYDYRTNVHHTLKKKPLRYDDMAEFVRCYNPVNRGSV